MARLRRLKERKRKNKIKIAACSLALALSIGSVQGLGTYALFTDIEDVGSNLSISTGDVDVEIENKTTELNLSNEKTEAVINFNILNNGTLNQYLKLNFGYSSINNKDLKNYIDFKLSSNKANIKFEDLGGNNYELYEGEEKLILNPGNSINVELTLKIKDTLDSEQKKLLSNQKIEIGTTVRANQIGYNNVDKKGFYDIANQKNTINIGELVESNNCENNLGSYITKKGKTISINIPTKYEIVSVEIDKDKSTGEFRNSKITSRLSINNNYSGLGIEKEDNSKFEISENFSDDCKLALNVQRKDGTKEVWEIKFRMNEKGKLETCYKVISSEILTEQDVQNPVDSDVEVPVNPDLVQPPKEEVVESNKQDEVQPPKEEIVESNKQDEVQPPKQEIVESNKQDEVQPPKEETVLQDKTDVTNSSKVEEVLQKDQTDIIAQKK